MKILRPQNLRDFANTSLAQDGSRHTLLCREKGASELQGLLCATVE